MSKKEDFGKIQKIMKKYEDGQELNEYDFQFALGLLDYHPRREDKIAVGVRAIIVGPAPKKGKQFRLIRNDGKREDFGYRKCLKYKWNFSQEEWDKDISEGSHHYLMGEQYQQYLDSTAWKENPARLAALKRANHQCEYQDGSPHVGTLDVHHTQDGYKRIGHEKPEDLMVLCHKHHEIIRTKPKN